MPKRLLAIGAALLCTALAGCSESPETTTTSTPAPAAPRPAATDYYTGVTIREIMDSLIDPQADVIWNAVRVVSDADGITEYYPQTAEEWADLRGHAVSIIEGANALMMPGRHVAPAGAEGEFPEFEFTPEEVEARLSEDRASWVGFAQGLQNAARNILDAIDNQDPDKLSEYGALLDEACEACHRTYWYRAGI